MCTLRSKVTPLPITELEIGNREFPGPISGAKPTLTSLEPEDPGRGPPTRLLGKRASNTARLFHLDKQMELELAQVSPHIDRHMESYLACT